jgi:hypothetical protein
LKSKIVIVLLTLSPTLIACQYVLPTRPTATLAPAPVPSIAPPTAAASPLPTLPGVSATSAPTSPRSAAPAPSIDPSTRTLQAGSSVEFKLTAALSPLAKRYTFQVQDLPSGITTELLGNPVPSEDTLVLNTTGSLAPGRYVVNLIVNTDAGNSAPAPITLEVTPCSEFQPGEFTESVRSRLVELITAGKPAVEHGLLVPLQICGGSSRTKHLKVTLEAVKSETGSSMSSPPRFYVYRSLAWPAPNSIQANPGAYWLRNVALPRTNSAAWQLDADLMPGLYLLVFERDRFDSTTDPKEIPGTVTFRLELK